MSELIRWWRWLRDGRPMDACGQRYPCAHRAYNKSCNHPYEGTP